MAKHVLVNLNLNGNELQNAVIQPLAESPATGKAGQLYYNTTDNLLYRHNGTAWAPVAPVQSVAGKTGAVTLVKGDVGLGNVDNTSDATKKTNFTGTIADGDSGFVTGDAAYDALALKLNLTGGTLTGDLVMGNGTTNHKITNLAAPTANADAANKKYVDDAVDALPDASDATPLMDGTAAAGSATAWSRGDHVHPTDTSRQAKITASGMLKGNGNGGVSSAEAGLGKDYYAPAATGIPKADLAQGVQDSLTAADNALPKAGGTMSGAIAMGGNAITGLADPTNAQDAATKKYADDLISGLGAYLTFKGLKTGTDQLPLTGNKKGDVWLIGGTGATASEVGDEYVWTLDSKSGTAAGWEKIGSNVDMSLYATLASPAFTGTPTAPTAATGTNTTQLATTAFVQQELAAMGGKTFVATGTIGTSATSATVTYTGTLVNAYATMGGDEVFLDKTINETAHTVTFTVAAAHSSAVTCNVVYAAAAAVSAGA